MLGSEAHVLINAGSRLNAGSQIHAEVLEHASHMLVMSQLPTAVHLVLTQIIHSFLAKQVDINAEN